MKTNVRVHLITTDGRVVEIDNPNKVVVVKDSVIIKYDDASGWPSSCTNYFVSIEFLPLPPEATQ